MYVSKNKDACLSVTNENIHRIKLAHVMYIYKFSECVTQKVVLQNVGDVDIIVEPVEPKSNLSTKMFRHLFEETFKSYAMTAPGQTIYFDAADHSVK